MEAQVRYEVDGVVLPIVAGGHPALDFCNTQACWNTPRPNDYLVSPWALQVWLREAGLLAADRLAADPPPAVRASWERTHEAALRLREALYRTALGERTPDRWAVLEGELAAARAAARLVPGPAGGPASWRLPAPVDPRAAPGYARHRLALLADDLLTSPAAGTVRLCGNPICGWLFADPRGRRRWCSMAVCGNRSKARRHRERHPAGR